MTSGQIATVRQIAVAAKYLDANGFHIGEMKPYTAVHNVHANGSWHYKTQTWEGKTYSLAADVNWGAPGTSAAERAKLTWAVTKVHGFGLSVIFALHGSQGVSAAHKTHLHMDCGGNSHLGTGFVDTKDKNLVVYDLQSILHVPTKIKYNVDNADLAKRLNAVKEASKYGGNDFPYGVKFAQQVVGAPLTGKADAHFYAAHDATVLRIEKLLKADKLLRVTPNTIWSADTSSAVSAFHKRY